MSVIVSRYASALLQAINHDDKIETEVKIIYDILSDNKKLQSLLRAPRIKYQLIDIITKDMSPLVVSFCKLLLKNNRLILLEKIVQKFLYLQREQNNEVELSITSATPLSEEELSEIDNKLRADKKANIINIVDESILGGIVIRRDYNIMDLSLKNKLEKFQEISKKGVLICR